jgi:Spy/CpxP family protein refolding chaperone
MKNFIAKKVQGSLVALVAIVVTVFASSCTDPSGVVQPSMADQSSEKVLASNYDYMSDLMSDNTSDMFAKGDRRGPGGKRDSVNDRGGDKDSVRGDKSNRPARLESVLPCLKLTAEQIAKLREFMTANRDCEKAARDQFRATIEPIRQRQKTAIDAIKEQVKAGTLTKADARTQIEALNASLKPAVQAAEAAMKAALEACRASLMANIESILTPEQLVIWMQWKTTGKAPCDPRTIGTRG